jgi:hypothetical protein
MDLRKVDWAFVLKAHIMPPILVYLLEGLPLDSPDKAIVLKDWEVGITKFG